MMYVISDKFVRVVCSIALFICALHCFGAPISEGLYMFAFGVLFAIVAFIGFGMRKASFWELAAIAYEHTHAYRENERASHDTNERTSQ